MKLMSLEIKNLVLGYEDKIIVNNIDLSIPKGEITMLIGANGCGKSTGTHRPGAGRRPFGLCDYADGASGAGRRDH